MHSALFSGEKSGDEDKIRSPFNAATLKQSRYSEEAGLLGTIATMQVQFRECDYFDLWIWLEFSTVPSTLEQQYVEEIFNSWFFLGKLGGFNAENLQVQETGLEISYLPYNEAVADESMMSVMHNMGEVEFEGTWARCWFDLGTCDAIALDVLINSLKQFSKDYVAIEQLYIGGENEDWKIPGSKSDSFADNN